MSASPSPKPSRWGRAIRRASTLLPGRPATPEAKDRASTSSDREDTDTGSLRRFGRSRSNTSLSNIQTQASAPSSPPPSQPSVPYMQPSPIAESPAREAAASLEELTNAPPAAAAAKSPLSQEVSLTPAAAAAAAAAADPQSATSPGGYVPPPLIDSSVSGPGGFTDDPDELPVSNPIPDPYAQGAVQQPEQQQQPQEPPVLDEGTDQPTDQVPPPPLIDNMAVGPGGFKDDLEDVPQSNTTSDPFAQPQPQPQPETDEGTGPGDQVSPPLIDNTAVGPGGFTDDLEDVPQSNPVSDPFTQPTFPEPEVHEIPLVPTPPEMEAPVPQVIERVPSAQQPTSVDPADPPIYRTIDGSIAFSSPPFAKSPPIPIPQRLPSPPPAVGNPFFVSASPEDAEEEQPSRIPVSMPVPLLPSQGGALPNVPSGSNVPLVPTVPSTPVPQLPHHLYADQYEDGNAGWSSTPPTTGHTQQATTTTTMPGDDSSTDSGPANRSLRNPFEDEDRGNRRGNGYLGPTIATAAAATAATAAAVAAMTVPAAMMAQGNSKTTSTTDHYAQNNYLSHQQKGYSGDDDSDSDESQPLLRKGQKAATTSYSFNPPPPIVGYNTFHHHLGVTPPRLRERGWIEIHLPYSSVYYFNPAERVVTDVELRTERLLDAITAHLNLEQHKDALERAPEGAELWLRDAGNAKRGFVPVRWWVVHGEKSVVFDKAFDVAVKRKLLKKKKDDDDQLDMEYRYWAFVEAHPSHVTLQPRAKQEAFEALNWAMTDPLLPTQPPLPAPFTQEECKTLLDLLRGFDSEPNAGNSQADAAIQTRTVARILIRVAQWRQQHFRPKKPLPTDVTARAPYPTYRRAFPRVLLDFTISVLCLGIPYLFIDRSRDYRTDEESGLRSVTPVYVIGVCSCLMAAIVLSASVTFLSLPGLDSITRIASLVAIISAVCSMASTLLAIFTIKSDLERPPQVIGGEGLLMISRRSVVMSLPVVFLLYSIIAFVTGVVLYSLKGGSITDASLVRRPVGEYMRWTMAGALGAFAGMVTISVLLFKR